MADAQGYRPVAVAGLVAQLVTGRASAAPGRGWLESARDDRVVTWAGAAGAVRTWARRLDGAAVPPGGRVGLRVADPLRFATAFVGILGAGRVVAPAAPELSPEAERRFLDSVRPALLASVRPGAPAPSADPAGLDGSWAALSPGPGSGDRPRLAGAGLLLASSGTTGPPKLVELDEARLLHTARQVGIAHDLGPADRGFNPLVLWHVNAEVVGLLTTLVTGGALVLDDRFHRTGFWKLLADREVSWLNAVPAVLAILAGEPPEPPPSAALRFARSASAPLPVATLEAFEAATGIPVVETYGMTEAGSQITANPVGDGRRPGSVGRPVGVELQVVDDGGVPVPAGTIGRVRIRGAGVVTSYAGEAGADRFSPGGWLDTGDLGSLDGDGWLTLAGRGDDVVNRGGEKFFPGEVEQVLAADPAAQQVVVVGWPDPVLGQVPVAAVVARPGTPPAEVAAMLDRMAAAATDRLDRVRRPVHLQPVGALPAGVNGKVSRRAVRDALVALVGGEPFPRRPPADPDREPR